jgi:5-methylcytosine-specific restriction protein A
MIMSTEESYKQLYKRLRESEFGCVPSGFHETGEVYELVRETYPSLCEDDIRCRDVCGTDQNQPEWKHRVRSVQQDLVRDSDSRIKRLSKGWYYEPPSVDIIPITEESTFQVGKKYNRWEVHDIFGGQRYGGIATPTEHPFVFLFTGESGEDYGYEDEFLPDDTFLYSGEGADGDMTMEGGNSAIREHRKDDKEIHLFEDTEYPWIVSYVGQFEYADHRWETLGDKRERKREAIRFELEPVGGAGIKIENGTPSSLSEEELFEKAKQSAPKEISSSSGRSGSSGGRSYARSEVVKEFALRHADGVCQGCKKEAPFVDKSGNPFLEVHHLHRRADGGPDTPENVIALCPNCHRHRHHGRDGDEFNQRLMEKAEERNQEFSEFSLDE